MRTALLGAVRRVLASVLTLFGAAGVVFAALAVVLTVNGTLLPIGPSPADQSSLCLPTSNVSGLSLLTRLNSAFGALETGNSGSTAPVNGCTGAPVAGKWWRDTSGANGVLKLYDGTAWQTVGIMDASTGTWTPPVGGGATSVASASTTDLWSVPQSYVVVTGTATITKLAGSGAIAGTIKTVSFAGALTLTHDGTQLILPGGRNLPTAVGDKAVVVALGGGNVAVLDYTPASGMAVQPVPTGHVDEFLLASCPGSWVDPNGGTVGDASSGATIRANADTFALFAAMWALDATVTPITTSAGGASTRGASAAADFAAHKRLVVPDMRAQFLRGLDDGRGVDTARLLGSPQTHTTSASTLAAGASSTASSTFTGDLLPPHAHTTTRAHTHGANGNSNPNWSDGDTGGGSDAIATNGVTGGTPSGTVATSVTTYVTMFGSPETRPVNVAVKVCIKL